MEIQQNIINRLDRMERTIEKIKEHLIDITMTDEERIMLDESVEHEKAGELISLGELEDVRNKVR